MTYNFKLHSFIYVIICVYMCVYMSQCMYEYTLCKTWLNIYRDSPDDHQWNVREGESLMEVVTFRHLFSGHQDSDLTGNSICLPL